MYYFFSEIVSITGDLQENYERHMSHDNIDMKDEGNEYKNNNEELDNEQDNDNKNDIDNDISYNDSDESNNNK
eukprot:3810939-Ditylum_brightwellii.AAC.1